MRVVSTIDILGRILPSLRSADISLRALVESASSFGLFVKFLLLEVTLFYCLSFIEGIEEHLGITPGNLIPSFKIWTLFTYALIDVHVWNLLRNLFFIFLAGKYVQPLWGDLELLLFYLITNTISGLWVTLLYLLSFMSMGNEEFLFETKICGLAAFIGGVFVALKQLLPEEVISSLPFLHIRVKHLPFTMFVLNLILKLAGLSGSMLIFLSMKDACDGMVIQFVLFQPHHFCFSRAVCWLAGCTSDFINFIQAPAEIYLMDLHLLPSFPKLHNLP